MKRIFGILSAASIALGLAVAPVAAQAPQGLKPASPACMATAKDYLQMKNAAAMYANAVPNIVQQTKDQLMASNLNYQKDLNEVAVIVAQKMAGREKEIGDGMAQVYCNEFTDKELADIVAFYKTPLGQKLLTSEPRAIQFSMSYMNGWAQNFGEVVNGEFRAEMHKRGKQI